VTRGKLVGVLCRAGAHCRVGASREREQQGLGVTVTERSGKSCSPWERGRQNERFGSVILEERSCSKSE
jgi:hypothetical protein